MSSDAAFPDRLADLSDLIDGWVAQGIITPEQAAEIRADVAAREETADGRGPSILAEALGYLGGAIVLVGLGLLLGMFWGDLPVGAKLVAGAVVTVGLGAAGGAVPPSLGPAGVRLRAVLWLATVVAGTAFLALLADDGFGWSGEGSAFFASSGAAVLGAVLWKRSRHLVQHIAVATALAVAAASLVALIGRDTGELPFAAAGAVGVIWFLLADLGVIRPSRPGRLVGAVIAGIGSAFIVTTGWGAPFALVTVLGLTLIAVRQRDLALLAVAAVATLIVVPLAVAEYFDGALAPAVALLVVGTLLIVAGVLAVRRNPSGTH